MKLSKSKQKMQNLSLKSPFTITTIEAIEKYDLRQLHKEVNKFAYTI